MSLGRIHASGRPRSFVTAAKQEIVAVYRQVSRVAAHHDTIRILLSSEYDPASLIKQAAMRRLWPADFIPGEAAQLLPLPRHFRQLAPLVTDDMITAPLGPDPDPYLAAIRAYKQAGFDEIYLGQVGGNLEGAFEFFAAEVLPRARES